jgi:hypothetical protein
MSALATLQNQAHAATVYCRLVANLCMCVSTLLKEIVFPWQWVIAVETSGQLVLARRYQCANIGINHVFHVLSRVDCSGRSEAGRLGLLELQKLHVPIGQAGRNWGATF